MIFKKKIPFFGQSNSMDCGPACLQMVSAYYGKYFTLERLRKLSGYNHGGVSLLGISEAAKQLGYATRGVKVTFDQLINDISHPTILFWDQKHFVVLLAQSTKSGKKIQIADPALGILKLSPDEFLKMWSNSVDEDGDPIGFAVELQPQQAFYNLLSDRKSIFNWKLVIRYFTSDYSRLFYILITIIFSIACQLAIPFFTMILVDEGITYKKPQLVILIVFAQLVVLIGKMISDFIRSRHLLIISSFININMSSDFWKKIMRLPLSYFETRRSGDIFQKLSDNKQVQSFLTGPAVNTAFSILTFITFSIVLFSYNPLFFVIFFLGMKVYFLWIAYFFNVKRKLNMAMNALATKQNDLSLQFINGINEIRIGGGERLRLNEWDDLQNRFFSLNSKMLKYNQIQNAGGLLISQGKDLIIIFLASKLIIDNQLSLGTLIAIQYIIGALSGPIEQMVGFSQNVLDTKQSINRLNDIFLLNEEPKASATQKTPDYKNSDINIEALTFTYPGIGNKPVLKNLNLTISQKKVTAIVGLSGSGKTTLLKLLLKFYDDFNGKITVGKEDLNLINAKEWRKQCGAVLQEGYIFNDTIEQNIIIDEETPQRDKLMESCAAANILDFISALPNGFQTKLGVDGVNLSVGQKQRLLIARAIYKNPTFLFFDEATNSLDAENEKMIVDNLNRLYIGKTVLIIAHRLSTVKNADNIVVLHNGEIIESGNHDTLIALKGKYFTLVRNQLSLDF